MQICTASELNSKHCNSAMLDFYILQWYLLYSFGIFYILFRKGQFKEPIPLKIKMLPHEVSAFSELDQQSKEGLDAVSLVSTSLATGESVIALGMLATVPECIIIETFLSVIKIDLPWFLATCCAQAALESLPFFAFCLLHRTLPVVWGRFWVVEQLLWTFVQVFRFGVWLIHPRNVHNVYFSLSSPSIVG